MAELSSITLFHFTDSLEKLQGILLDGIRSSFVSEKISGRNLAYFSDMICFCDIPLSKVKDHTKWYGEYAIGVRPEFLKEQGVTPVIYTHSRTPFLIKGESEKTRTKFAQLSILSYLKRCSGMQCKKHSNQFESKRFIDEREWRIVRENSSEVVKFQNLGDLSNQTNLKMSSMCTPLVIQFDPSDIEYIIVSSREEIPTMVKWLKDIFNDNFQDYSTKLIAYSQIARDF